MELVIRNRARNRITRLGGVLVTLIIASGCSFNNVAATSAPPVAGGTAASSGDEPCLKGSLVIAKQPVRDLGKGYVIYEETYESSRSVGHERHACLYRGQTAVAPVSEVYASPSGRFIVFYDWREWAWVLMDENGDRGAVAPLKNSRWHFDEVQWDEPGGVVRIVYSDGVAPDVVPLRTMPPAPADAAAALRHFRECLDRVAASTNWAASSGCSGQSVAALTGVHRHEIIASLGQPQWCLGPDHLNYLPAAQCEKSSTWGYLFYRFPPTFLGGGPELIFDFDEGGRANARWLHSQ